MRAIPVRRLEVRQRNGQLTADICKEMPALILRDGSPLYVSRTYHDIPVDDMRIDEDTVVLEVGGIRFRLLPFDYDYTFHQ